LDGKGKKMTCSFRQGKKLKEGRRGIEDDLQFSSGKKIKGGMRGKEDDLQFSSGKENERRKERDRR